MKIYSCSSLSIPQIILAGDVYIEAPNNHFPRTPAENILYYVYEGHMQLVEGDTQYDIKAGDMIILDKGVPHHGIKTASSVRYIYVHYIWESQKSGEITQEDYNMMQLKNTINAHPETPMIFPKYISHGHASENVLEKLSQIIQCMSEARALSQSLPGCYFVEMLAQALGESHAENKEHGLPAQIVKYLRENCRRNLTSEDLENHFHMNFDYMNRVFKKSTGMTILNCHNRYRISESTKYIKSHLLNVREVASYMGFSNEFYFSRVYKKYEGVSPRTVK